MLRAVALQLGVPESAVTLGAPIVAGAPVNIRVVGAQSNVTLTDMRLIAVAANASRVSATGVFAQADVVLASTGGRAAMMVAGAAAAAVAVAGLVFNFVFV